MHCASPVDMASTFAAGEAPHGQPMLRVGKLGVDVDFVGTSPLLFLRRVGERLGDAATASMRDGEAWVVDLVGDGGPWRGEAAAPPTGDRSPCMNIFCGLLLWKLTVLCGSEPGCIAALCQSPAVCQSRPPRAFLVKCDHARKARPQIDCRQTPARCGGRAEVRLPWRQKWRLRHQRRLCAADVAPRPE